MSSRLLTVLLAMVASLVGFLVWLDVMWLAPVFVVMFLVIGWLLTSGSADAHHRSKYAIRGAIVGLVATGSVVALLVRFAGAEANEPWAPFLAILGGVAASVIGAVGGAFAGYAIARDFERDHDDDSNTE